MAAYADFDFEDDESDILYENITQTKDNDNLLKQSFFSDRFELG